MIIFYFLFIIGYLLLAICRPKWALFLICALLPTYQIRFQIFGLPTTLLEIMIVVLFIVWFFKFKIYLLSSIKHLGSSVQGWFWPILAWLVVGLVAAFVSPDKWGALGHWRAYFLEPILFLVVAINLVKAKKDWQLIFTGLGISALYCSIWAILQKWLGGGVMSLETWRYPLTDVWRATGPFPQPNFLGLYLAPIVILMVGQIISRIKNQSASWRTRIKVLFYCFIVLLSVIAIILARSEGALLGIAAGLIFVGLLCNKSRKWVLTGLIILIIIGISLPITRNYLLEKITFQDFSGQIRLKIWSETLTMLKEQPVFGAGLRGYQTIIEKYHQTYLSPEMKIPIEIHPYPHNLLLAVWSELGILGLIVFFWILIKFFKATTNYKSNTNIQITNNDFGSKFIVYSLISAMVVVIVHGLVDTPYFKNDLAILFWLIVGLWISYQKIARQE